MLKELFPPQEAKDIGDEFLALEKFVNLNYLVGSAAIASACNSLFKKQSV